MRQFKGIARNMKGQVFGMVTRNPFSLSRANRVLVTDEPSLLATGFAGLITKDHGCGVSRPQIKVHDDTLGRFKEGDCVLMEGDGTISVLWETSSPMNSLFLTEACDCRCIMCPQPPKEHDRGLVEISKHTLSLVDIRKDQVLCLTGGEPTLLKEEFFEVLRLISKKHPKASTMMLTNGKSFAEFGFTKRFVSERPKDFLTCISMHGDVDELHDQIVGVKGSFYKTAMGLQNLARFREKIEIRVVVNRLNAHRLESIATFIQRNFPFIYHCTFMAMEITGLASDNYETVWIDPHEYRDQLSRAVSVLNRADIYVSIYNLPLCLVESRSWNFARKSISGWKNDYLPVCESCLAREDCCGVFTTSGLHQSPHICPPVNV